MTEQQPPPGEQQPPPGGQEPPRATEPYGSIIERFRGTEWDSHSVPGPTPPRTPLSRVLILLGIGALVIAGSLVVAGVLGNRPGATYPSFVAATPQPTPGPEDLLVAAFWKTIEAPGLGYHVEQQASATAGTQSGGISTSLDVSGDDFSGTFDITLKSDPFAGAWSIVRSGGIAYLRRDDNGAWQSGTANQIELRMAPFLSLVDHRQLRYAGVVTEGASTLYRLVSTDLYRPSVSRILPILEVAVPKETFSLELIVTVTGIPVRATLTAHADADPAINAPALDVTASYTFSRFGEIGPISPPKL